MLRFYKKKMPQNKEVICFRIEVVNNSYGGCHIYEYDVITSSFDQRFLYMPLISKIVGILFWFLSVYMHVCACMHVCVCACMCVCPCWVMPFLLACNKIRFFSQQGQQRSSMLLTSHAQCNFSFINLYSFLF